MCACVCVSKEKVHFFNHPCSQCPLAVLKGPVNIGKRDGEQERTARNHKRETAAKNTVEPEKQWKCVNNKKLFVEKSLTESY